MPEAARLIRVGRARRIYGWLRGYPQRKIGPLLERDYEPFDSLEELSFLDLMEVRFVEHFREHGVKGRSLRIAADQLRRELKTPHPFASEHVHVIADKADIMIEEILRASAEQAGDKRLRSLLTQNYVMYEAIKQTLLPGVTFGARDHLAERWVPVPKKFPTIAVDPRIAYGQPAGPTGIPTHALYDAWKAEGENPDAVAYWYEIPTTDVLNAVKFERLLDEPRQEQAA